MKSLIERLHKIEFSDLVMYDTKDVFYFSTLENHDSKTQNSQEILSEMEIRVISLEGVDEAEDMADKIEMDYNMVTSDNFKNLFIKINDPRRPEMNEDPGDQDINEDLLINDESDIEEESHTEVAFDSSTIDFGDDENDNYFRNIDREEENFQFQGNEFSNEPTCEY